MPTILNGTLWGAWHSMEAVAVMTRCRPEQQTPKGCGRTAKPARPPDLYWWHHCGRDFRGDQATRRMDLRGSLHEVLAIQSFRAAAAATEAASSTLGGPDPNSRHGRDDDRDGVACVGHRLVYEVHRASATNSRT